jgi:hypothetical protein
VSRKRSRSALKSEQRAAASTILRPIEVSPEELKRQRLNELVERNKECNEYIKRTEGLLQLIKIEQNDLMAEISQIQACEG